MSHRFGALPYTLNFPNYSTKKLWNDYIPYGTIYNLSESVESIYYKMTSSEIPETPICHVDIPPSSITDEWLIPGSDPERYHPLYPYDVDVSNSLTVSFSANYSEPIILSNNIFFGFQPSYLSSGGFGTGGLSQYTAEFYSGVTNNISHSLPYGFDFLKLKYPIAFRVSSSFCYTNNIKVGFDYSIYDSLISEQLNTLLENNRTKNAKSSLTYYGSISSYIEVNSYGNLMINSDIIQFKLLNKQDFITCSNTPMASFDNVFFDSLTSPTLKQACENGGCQFFGILKQQKPPLINGSSLSITGKIFIKAGDEYLEYDQNYGGGSGAQTSIYTQTHSVEDDAIVPVGSSSVYHGAGSYDYYYGTTYGQSYTADPSPNPIAHAICLLP